MELFNSCTALGLLPASSRFKLNRIIELDEAIFIQPHNFRK